MKIGITGGRGFIGQALTDYFLEHGHELLIFTRSHSKKETPPGLTYSVWDPEHLSPPNPVPQLDVLINLAGATINKRWTEDYKKEILESRIEATKMVQSILRAQHKPAFLINASAIGYYGTSVDKMFTEDDIVPPSDFLSSVVNQWEDLAMACEPFCSRVVAMRFGLVLGKDQGAFPKLALPYKFFLGGRFGSGAQWVSWIHINDLVRLTDFVIKNADITGTINATAPEPVRMNQFGQTIANVMHRPHFFPVPEFALKTMLGEMSELLIKGQNVRPKKALDHGFSFKYSELKPAVKALTI